MTIFKTETGTSSQ